jgi:hypothetical protein
MAAPVRQRSVAEILEAIEAKLDDQAAELARMRREMQARKRAGAKRRGTVAERSAARVQSEPVAYQPTPLQIARVRRKMLAGRP